jgi:hypothetical protein
MAQVKREPAAAPESSSSDDSSGPGDDGTTTTGTTTMLMKGEKRKRPVFDERVHLSVMGRPAGPGMGPYAPYEREWVPMPLWLDSNEPHPHHAWVDTEQGEEFAIQLHNNGRKQHYAGLLYMDGKEAWNTMIKKRRKVRFSHVAVDQHNSYNLPAQTQHLGRIELRVYAAEYQFKLNGERRRVATIQPRNTFQPSTVQAPEMPEKRDIILRTPAISVGAKRTALPRARKQAPSRWHRQDWLTTLTVQYGPGERRPARYSVPAMDLAPPVPPPMQWH